MGRCCNITDPPFMGGDDFSDKITSEKYKEKRRKRDAEIDRMKGEFYEMYENSEKYKNQRKRVKKLLKTQLASVGALVGTIILLIIFLG